MWIIDFPTGITMEAAALYAEPFEYVHRNVRNTRLGNKRDAYAEQWWLHMEPRPGMRQRLASLSRFAVTPCVSKHRLFVWVKEGTLPDHALIVFAREDDYFFGVLHSRVHEIWARANGTQLREVESGFRYTPTTTFETFPFPEPTTEQVAVIAQAAERLNELREGWLNPPEDSIGPSLLRKRTLTNFYNDDPVWLNWHISILTKPC